MDFEVPKVMAIVNITPDSFYSSGRSFDEGSIRKRIYQITEEKADIIDVGGCSTRPGSSSVEIEEEYSRLARALEVIRETVADAVVSVDTWRAEIALKCVEEWDVDIINDISGGSMDPEIWDVVAEKKVGYVLTHSRGAPENMAYLASYEDVTAEVVTELSKKLYLLRQKKINDIIIDPGFGFAKTPSQSLRLLDELNELCRFGLPVMAALSRKSMIWKTLDLNPEESYEGTIALDAIALDRGADILRVHDVKAAVRTVRLLTEMKGKCRYSE